MKKQMWILGCVFAALSVIAQPSQADVYGPGDWIVDKLMCSSAASPENHDFLDVGYKLRAKRTLWFIRDIRTLRPNNWAREVKARNLSSTSVDATVDLPNEANPNDLEEHCVSIEYVGIVDGRKRIEIFLSGKTTDQKCEDVMTEDFKILVRAAATQEPPAGCPQNHSGGWTAYK